MKRCPECRRDYYDDTLLYCLDDGTPLLDGPSGNGSPTEELPMPRIGSESPTSPQIFPVKVEPVRAQPSRVPANVGPLIGRLREVAEVKSAMESNDVRLVTLTGIGGTGKTRISIEIASQLAPKFTDGIFFIELAAVNDRTLVAATICHALGVKEVISKAMMEALADHLEEKAVLLILDNFEQVANAGVDLSELLRRTRYLKMLVTSREPLKLSRETEYQVPPLALPSADTKESVSSLMNSEAVQFFVDRARRARPDFEITEENAVAISAICNKLDGLPLALELAAARAKILSPAAILDKLDNRLEILTGGSRDLPARQQTMRSAIEWSFDLLNEREKNVFSILSVFEGGFTFRAAEEVASRVGGKTNDAADRSGTNLLDIVTSLSEKSLIISEKSVDDELRFHMLQVVSEYALEILARGPDMETVRRAHADYYLSVSEEAEPYLRSLESAEWLKRLEIEHENICAAIQSSIVNAPEVAARIAAAIRNLWIPHGHIREGQYWLEAILAKADNISPRLRWELLIGLGNMTQFRGDLQTALNVYQASLDEARLSDDQGHIAQSLRGLGAIEYIQGELASARGRINEAIAISRSLNDEFGTAASLARLGDIAAAEGDTAEARERTADALEIFRRLGYKSGIASKLTNLGKTEILNDHRESARVVFRESLEICIELGDVSLIRLALDGFAALFVEAGDLQNAARLFSASASLGDALEFPLEPAEQRFRGFYLEKLRGEMSKPEFDEAYSEGRSMTIDHATSLALSTGNVEPRK